MANIIRLPINQNLPWFGLNVTLDQVSYHLELAYVTRSNRWTLTLADASGEPILRQLPVMIDRDLVRAYHHLPVPPGMLICIDTTGKQQPPTLGSFLTTHVLYYIESGF